MNAPFDATKTLDPTVSDQNALDFQVAVVGLGYIGLPTAAVLASYGWRVCGVDICESVVQTVNGGGVHIEERDLDKLVGEGVSRGRLQASTLMPEANFYMIAVPTPLAESNEPDIGYVEEAARAIAPKLQKGACVILESTSPVRTTERVAEIFAELRPDLTIPAFCDETNFAPSSADIALAYCPERVLPGKIVTELVENDRVIGGMTPVCAERAAALYSSFVQGTCLVTNARVAETVKLVENSFRDVNIAFANELSMIADEIGVDVWNVIRLANRHPRVNILQPGPGVGGHCIAVDPWFLVAGSPTKARLVRMAREVNDHKAKHTEDRIRALVQSQPDSKVALLGLAFKPDIDDFRESPALEIAEQLAPDLGTRMMVVEPFANVLSPVLEGAGATLTDLDAALNNADIVVVLVDHSQFKSLDQERLNGKIVFDTRGMFSQ